MKPRKRLSEAVCNYLVKNEVTLFGASYDRLTEPWNEEAAHAPNDGPIEGEVEHAIA
jgi:hypothetical protein